MWISIQSTSSSSRARPVPGHGEFIMPATIDGWFLIGLLSAIAIGFAARVAVFLASCALADAGEPKLIKAVVLGLLALAICGPASWFILVYLKDQLPSPDGVMFGPAHAIWLVLTA